MNRRNETTQKTKLNKTIPSTGTIEFKLWNQNGWQNFDLQLNEIWLLHNSVFDITNICSAVFTVAINRLTLIQVSAIMISQLEFYGPR